MHELAIIGDGRVGRALTAALRAAGRPVTGPLGRCPDVGSAHVLLCVPDGEIAAAAAAIPVAPGRLVGHVSGATTLAPLHPHEAFSLHPLMTVTAQTAQSAQSVGVVPVSQGQGRRTSVFDGAGAAVAGATDAARAFAERLAADLGMTPIEVPDADRAAYHAAASIASNFLVTLQAAAEQLLGHDREVLVPLVRATVENWAAQGPERALTGPIARGDEVTVQRQRQAIAERAPELLAMFDALADATRDVARRGGPGREEAA
jgi:predicted short-subunit dehydrogenase-like oxidoreductase (DUF2520 family)